MKKGAPVVKDLSNPAQPDIRRLLFAQIVEDDDPLKFSESAILEGAAYKYFLKSVAQTSHDSLRKQTDESITFDSLMNEPGLYRGHVITLARGIVLEAARADLPPDYGLPPGYTVLPCVFVDSAHDVYSLRILCPPGSRLYEKLKEGIDKDAFPVCRITGYFMKLYARRTADPSEVPWRRPLLVCPEPEFSKVAGTRKVYEDLVANRLDRFLPSSRIDEAPGAEERLVVEVYNAETTKGYRVEVRGEHAGANLGDFIRARADAFRARLPDDQQNAPAAVILLSGIAPRWALDDVVPALRNADIRRLAVKRDR